MTVTQRTDDSLRGWQSDVIVDCIQRYGFPFITLNPGASFRGLHDSLINYGRNDPPMMLCQHEEIAVQVAHGYSKATGQPTAVILHNLVGLLHATMAIYYAFIDRAPVFIMGATGPMDEGRRRPHIDWTHTALVQGNAVRDYVKWDYQPTSIVGVPEAFARAYSVMTTEPPGPVYLCFDAELQEQKLGNAVSMAATQTVVTPAPALPDPATLAQIADRLLAAENPLLLAEFVGRRAGGFEAVIALAETLGAAVWDINSALNFPNRHPLCASLDPKALATVDVVLGLDVKDWEKGTHKLESTTREVQPLVAPGCVWMEIGCAEIGLSKWSFDYGRLPPLTIRALGDILLGLRELTRLCAERIAAEPALQAKVRARADKHASRHAATWQGWQTQAKENWTAAPATVPRLALEIWDVIKDEDWVLTANTLKTWVRKLWTFDKPHQHPGADLGTSTQIGISLGVALAHKEAGRIVVDIQPDGDLMFDAGALWFAAKHQIPMLIVMYNNRAYYNDWEHQIRMARLRGTDEGKAHIGMDLYDPAPDFATLARSMGVWAEGPIENPDDIGPALRRALAEVKQGRPALVDTITQHR